MLKRVSTILATLFMGGCAAILNSDRPKFHGSTVKPVWSIPHLSVGKTPVIHDGIVFVQASESSQTHLYAFEVQTGKQLWVSKLSTDQMKAVIGPRIIVTDDKGLIHALDTKTGKEFGEPAPSTMLSATADGNILYAIFQDGSVMAFAGPTQMLWKAGVPMNVLFRPVVGGGNMYVYGQTKDDKGVKLGCAIHVFDARSGSLRWKWESEECGGPEDNPVSFLAADSSAAYIAIDSKTIDGKAGMVLAFDAATGKQKWSSPTVQFLPGGPILFDASTVVICDNIPDDHGGTANRKNPNVLRGLDRNTGQLKWESRTSWKYWNWTAQDGLLFVADRQAHALIGTGNDTSPDSFLTVVDIRAGRELWRSDMVQLATFSEPAVGEGMVVVGSQPFGDQNPEAAGLFAFRANRTGK